MSEENNSSVEAVESVESSQVSPESTGESVADLKTYAASAFDEDPNEFDSNAENPEDDDNWAKEALSNLEKEEEEQNEEEDTSKDDSEQSDDPTPEEKNEEAKPEDSNDSEKEKEKPEESTEEPSTSISVKVDGEVLDLTLEQIRDEHPEVLESLKSGISGAKASAKRFSELDAEKKEFYSQKEEIEGYVSKFEKSTKDGNILGGLTYFAEFANIPPYLLKEQLIASLKPEIDKRAQMSQDQINNMRLRDENEYLTEKNESDQSKWQEEQARQAAEAAQMELQNQINSIRETHEINDSEWDAAYEALDKELPPEMDQIPLKAIEEKILSQRAELATEQRLQTLVNPVSDQVNDTFVNELRSLIQSHPQLTDQDLQTVIKDSLAQVEKKELEKQLKKKQLSKPKKLVKNDLTHSAEELRALVDWD